MEADEHPVRGRLMRLERPPRIVTDDERGATRAQQLVDLRHEPALVPKLEAMAARRQLPERIRKAPVVAMEVSRQLPEHRPQLGRPHERLDPFVEPPDTV